MAHTVVKAVETHKSQTQGCSLVSTAVEQLKTNSYPLTSVPCCIEIQKHQIQARHG